MNPAHVAWCRSLFDTLAEGGVWGVPRSGLIFRRVNGRLELFDRMPHVPDMPISAKQLADYQRRDFEATKTHFALAGIAVVDKTKGDAL